MELSSALLERTCNQFGVYPKGVVLHSDNGGPKKGSTMLATLQRLGIVPSFSRDVDRREIHLAKEPTSRVERDRARRRAVEQVIIRYELLKYGAGMSTDFKSRTGTDSLVATHFGSRPVFPIVKVNT